MKREKPTNVDQFRILNLQNVYVSRQVYILVSDTYSRVRKYIEK